MGILGKVISSVVVTIFMSFCGIDGAVTIAESAVTDNNRYIGGQSIALYANETIEYIDKTVIDDVVSPKAVPVYYTDTLPNACGAVAGAIAVGYYDYYYENMIPGWKSALSSGRFKTMDSVYVPKLLQQLYNDMRTNVVAPGVSENEFLTGFSDYVNSNGYSAEYRSIWNGRFDVQAFKSSLKNNEVSVLFLPSCKYNTIDDCDGVDIITENTIAGNHIMVAYGYREVNYRLRNGMRTDTYIMVATGLSDVKVAYVKADTFMGSAYVIRLG